MSLKAIGDEELLDYVIEKDFEDTVARIIISSVSLFDEGVGRVKLTRILKGKDPGFVIMGRPEMRASYGRLRMLDEDQVMDFIESLLRLSLLDIRDPEFPRIAVTKKGEKVLGSAKLIPAQIPWPLPSKDVPIPVDREAYEELRKARNRIAREEGLPPYCVAPNLSLVEMVNRSVTEVSDLESIPGIGNGRMERYGEELLKAMAGT
ncbi:MAG: HRDC domain-containing protein [Thermoplasmatota archaeon]